MTYLNRLIQIYNSKPLPDNNISFRLPSCIEKTHTTHGQADIKSRATAQTQLCVSSAEDRPRSVTARGSSRELGFEMLHPVVLPACMDHSMAWILPFIHRTTLGHGMFMHVFVKVDRVGSGADRGSTGNTGYTRTNH